MSDDDKRNWMSCLGWGCLVVVVVSALGIGGCVAYVYKGGSAAGSVSDGYLAAVEEGRFEDAFQALGSDFTEERGLMEFVTFEQETRSRLGACRDWRRSGTSIDRVAGRSEATLTHQGSCDQGPVEVVFSLEQIDQVWVIQDIRYREPGVAVVPTCADCGAPALPAAKFCSACGTAFGETEEPPEDAEGEGEPTE